MEERLSKLIAQAGLASRREADRMVHEGRVTVNGAITIEPGHKVDVGHDHVKVDGKLITSLPSSTYLVIHKPRGVLATRQDPEGRPTITSLLKGVKGRLIPVGKLDWDDEGLLFLSNDGELVQRMSDPKAGFPHSYLAKVRGVPDEKTLVRLRTGVPLEDGRSLPMEARLVSITASNAWLQVTLRESRSHLLKRTMAKLNHPIVKLRRTSFGPLNVKGLAPGVFRHLTPEEVTRLKTLAENPPGLPEPAYISAEAEHDATVRTERGDRVPLKRPKAPARQTRATTGEDEGGRPQRASGGKAGGKPSSGKASGGKDGGGKTSGGRSSGGKGSSGKARGQERSARPPRTRS